MTRMQIIEALHAELNSLDGFMLPGRMQEMLDEDHDWLMSHAEWKLGLEEEFDFPEEELAIC